MPLGVGADVGGALAWFKEKMSEAEAVGDLERVSRIIARLIEVMARNGMDITTRASLLSYVKTQRLISAAELERITLRRIAILVSHSPADMDICIFPVWERIERIFCAAWCCARGCVWV